ncbi:hypothetical protein YWIDRAFT_03455 [Streptomyces sp. SceaMP-e96]|uniref:hypothetical protein n=1 Tax=unclassified Streptomyces TaxID=2593676 RepID=UPI000823AEC2|nr:MULTISPECIES: hypothetical protein [unclassified Streptomyces]MYT14081.1 hypothetical protein [Streptomyces sp. SID4951]SCK57946.1 hypothetical protein YWIDRAFT_03455 [Streptomyces sp. SceaMP-e96]
MAGFNIDKRAIEKMQREIAKEFERAARKHPVRVPLEVGSPELAARSRTGATTEKDPYLSRLLIWLDDLATLRSGRSAEVSTFVDAEGLPPAEAKSMALQLEQQGLARIQSDLGGKDSIVSLTDMGALEARRLRALRSDSVARFVHACDALLHWMFQTGRGRNQVEVMAFVEAPGSYFAGESLTIDEILGALEHLAQRELVRRVTTEPTTAASVRAEVTESGTDCVLSGGSVSDYLSRRQSLGDTYNFTNSSGIVAGSRGVVQNNSFSFDASALAEFAGLVRQFAPALDASEEQQEALIKDVEVLEEVTAADQPEPGRVRAAYLRVQEALAGLTATSAGLTLLVQKGQEAYSAVFRN